MTIISKDITKAVAILNNEDVVAIPTETVYGLAGNIFSEKAIQKIFNVKQRPQFNPLIVHIHSIDQIDSITRDFPEKARKLANTFWPGPLTLILKKNEIVPDLITAGKDTVAVRMPNHPLSLKLLRELSFPLAAPSANPFNRISPTKPEHVEAYFKSEIPMVLDGGRCERGIESTIIGFENNEAILFRMGSISIEDIEKAVGPIKIKTRKENTPEAPGMLAKHYAPKTKTYLVKDIESFIRQHPGKRIGVIRFSADLDDPSIVRAEILSSSGNLDEAASRLYDALHTLDELELDLIVAELFPDEGLGRSINDRLERATN